MFANFFADPAGTLISLLIALPGVVLAITVHESAHGWASLMLGDDTAKKEGRISLNPLRHVDILGLLLLLLLRFGWARPVSVNPSNFKKPKRDMCLTSLAGPASNLVLSFFLLALAMGFSLLYGRNYQQFGDTSFSTLLEVLVQIFRSAAITNLGLGVFNLLPCPPLDGWKVVSSLLPLETYFKLMRFERYGMYLLLVLMLAGVLTIPVNMAIGTIYSFYYNVLVGVFGLFL